MFEKFKGQERGGEVFRRAFLHHILDVLVGGKLFIPSV